MSMEDMNYYINEIKNITNKFEEKNKHKPSYIQRTYGCQMNEHDSEHVEFSLQEMGFEKSSNEDADLVFINTCAIRQTAANKAYGFIGSLKSLKEKNPDLILIVSGCLPELDEPYEKFIRSFKHIDILMGTSSYYYLPKYIYDSFNTNQTILGVEDQYDFQGNDIKFDRLHKHKSFVNITYGCNNFCSYCIVPYARGRERSRELNDIVEEVRKLVADGVKEVTLLGQNVNSYGKTLDDKKSFANLLEEINKIEGLERIRFMTPHPKDISDELINAYGNLDKLSSHLHLPIQAGSDKVLKEMNRNYTVDKYLKIIDKIKRVNPKISLSTDIMVGFPGETEEDFQGTLDVVEKVGYDFVFTFLYSPRQGTPASNRKDQVPQDIKTDRFNRLTEKIDEIALEKNKKLIGQNFEVLVDEVSKTDQKVLSGRTDGFKLVNFEGDESLIGSIVDVKITDVNTFALEGELL